MILADMSARKRRETLNVALACVLTELTAPAATPEVAERIARRLGIAASEQGLLSRTLVQLAPLYPEAQRGTSFVRFGRPMRRWVWSPRADKRPQSVPEREPQAATVENMPRCLSCGDMSHPSDTDRGLCFSCRQV